MQALPNIKDKSLPITFLKKQEEFKSKIESCDIKNISRFDLKHLDIITHRGKGSFSHVYDTRIVRKDSKKEAYYAVKFPRREKKSNIRGNIRNLFDEAQTLSQLNHRNIIKLKGISNSDMEYDENLKLPYFIIIESLSYTLENQVRSWRGQGIDIKTSDFLRIRLRILQDIASAINYLHQRKIMHRDIKPQNIGFDKDGTVKIFDFDLAVKLKAENRNENGLYNLQGGIGTNRYMAPEIASFQSYNESADIYSFGLLIWHILTLETPYVKYNCRDWVKFVVLKGERPKIDESWSFEIQDMVEASWSEISFRPSSQSVFKVLANEISLLSSTISKFATQA